MPRREQGAADAPRDLFDLIATARDPESVALCPPRRLADQVATMIVAGHETTAVAPFWSLFLLAGTLAIQDRVAAEARPLDLGPDHAFDSLPRLLDTRAVVHKALRLYPPAFTLARQAIRPDIAGEIEIPARGVVLISPWVLHRHRLLWIEPETFDPSRFLPPAPAPGRFAYLPFGIGAGIGNDGQGVPHRAGRRRPGHPARHRHQPARSCSFIFCKATIARVLLTRIQL